MESIVEIQRLSTIIGGGDDDDKKEQNEYSDATQLFAMDEIDEEREREHSVSRSISVSNAPPPFIDSSSSAHGVPDAVEYSGCNPIEFFRLPFMYPSKRQSIIATECREFACPITGKGGVERLEISKVFPSNAKPLLIDCYLHNAFSPCSSFILKFGDDLRRDAAVLMLFKFMNSLWNDHHMKYQGNAVAALTYKCYPIGPDYGIIELIPDCLTLKDVTDRFKGKKGDDALSDKVINNMIATSAGSFMAAYIMGIRDRHYDNVLVNIESGTIFHIDFGYMMGEKVAGVDTAKFAITKDLTKLMGPKWTEFVAISVQSWVVLRQNHQELLDFAKLAFAYLYPQQEVEQFLRESLLLSMSVEDGRSVIEKRLLKAPKKLKTKMKNWVHSMASSTTFGNKEEIPKPPPSPESLRTPKKGPGRFKSFLKSPNGRSKRKDFFDEEVTA